MELALLFFVVGKRAQVVDTIFPAVHATCNLTSGRLIPTKGGFRGAFPPAKDTRDPSQIYSQRISMDALTLLVSLAALD